jgi:hypothetical protein
VAILVDRNHKVKIKTLFRNACTSVTLHQNSRCIRRSSDVAAWQAVGKKGFFAIAALSTPPVILSEARRKPSVVEAPRARGMTTASNKSFHRQTASADTWNFLCERL